jgi:methyltransferase (TIGR00027 family)
VQQGQASWTARGVASQRLRFARVPSDHGQPEDDQRLHADVAAGINASDTELTSYLRARTRFIDQALVNALDAGIEQVLIVGAGYDGRAWRYARSGVRWFELDHPDTQVDKIERVTRLGLRSDHVVFVAAEIGRDRIDRALLTGGYDASSPTVMVCEGLVSYLPPDTPGPLFTTLYKLSAPGSRLAVQLALEARDENTRQRRERLDSRFRQLGEPLRTRFTADDLPATVRGWGWHLDELTDPAGRPLAESTRGAAFLLAHA